MRGNSHVRCGTGEKTAIASKSYLSLLGIVTNKAKFISQVMTSKEPVRVAEDIDETVLTYSQMQAIASGNQMIKEKIQLDSDVMELKNLEAEHKKSVYAMQELAERKLPSMIENYTDLLKKSNKDLESYKQRHSENSEFQIELNGKIYDDRAEAGEELEKALIKCAATEESITVGKYLGFVLSVEKNQNKGFYEHPYMAVLQGELKYTTEAPLKNSIGNIRRIENLAEKQIEQKVNNLKESLEKAKKDLSEARANTEKPFERAEELAKKVKRLEYVNMKLSEGEADDITSVSKPAEPLSITISMPVASCSDKFNYKPKAEIIAEQQQINPKLKNPFKKHLR